MIRIIHEGTRKIEVCEQCGCMFSYEKEDIKTDDNIEYTVGSRYKYVNCPQCTNGIILEGTR